MEEYDRDSLRRLRKEAMEHETAGRKGSRFVSMLIILMFLFAGGLYIKTTDPVWLTGSPGYTAVSEKLKEWKEVVFSSFNQKEETSANDVQETVNAALNAADEA